MSEAVPDTGLRRRLEGAGFDVCGVLEAAHYDALVPGAWQSARRLPAARSALLMASGGRSLWRALQVSPERDGPHPVDRYTRRVVGEVVARLGTTGRAASGLLACDRHGGAYADFVALGRAAGLGTPGRLGLLLHPVFGPWLSIRAVVLTGEAWPETPPLEGFDPCAGCPAPCAQACPGGAPRDEGFDLAACDATRRITPACASRCEARHACLLGPEHAYPPEAEAHHMAQR